VCGSLQEEHVNEEEEEEGMDAWVDQGERRTKARMMRALG